MAKKIPATDKTTVKTGKLLLRFLSTTRPPKTPQNIKRTDLINEADLLKKRNYAVCSCNCCSCSLTCLRFISLTIPPIEQVPANTAPGSIINLDVTISP